MGQLWAITRREYLTRVRTTAFLIGTFVGPVAFVALVAVPLLVSRMQVREHRRIVVIEDGDAVSRALKASHFFGMSSYVVEPVARGGPTGLDELRAEVRSGRLYGILVAPPGRDDFEFETRNVGDFDEVEALRSTLTTFVVEGRLRGVGLDPQRIHDLTRSASVRAMRVTESGEKEERGQTFVFAQVLTMLLYVSLLMYGVSIMRSVIEEKSSRIVEVILSSVSPFTLMAGKILGVGSVGLTQYLIWTLVGVLVSLYGGMAAAWLAPGSAAIAFGGLQPSAFAYFLLYFVLGYFLYSTLYAAVGAMVNTEQDSQQLQMFVTLFLIVPMLVLPGVTQSPDSRLSIGLSLFPLFSPVLMMLRIGLVRPPASQILASVFLTVATAVMFTWLSARIYRIGILMYGKRPSLPEIFRWIRSA